MKIYPPNVRVRVTVPFIDLNGDPITPTAVSVIIRDSVGEQIGASFEATFAEGDTDAELAIEPSYNAEPGVRLVDVTLTTADGTYPARVAYAVRGEELLTVPATSFQTTEEAELLASTLPNLSNWSGASPDLRRAALAQAFRNLVRLAYRIRPVGDWDDDIMFDFLDGDIIVQPRFWPVMTLADWKKLPDRFRLAICRAQIMEANELLNTSGVADRRRSGLLSETIGESSMMFRSGKPLDLGIAAAALKEMTGYLDIRMTTTRS